MTTFRRIATNYVLWPLVWLLSHALMVYILIKWVADGE